MLQLVLFALPCLLLSGVVVYVSCRSLKLTTAKVALGCSLTMGVSLGISSIAYFTGLMLLRDRAWFNLFELVLLAAAGITMALVWRVCRFASSDPILPGPLEVSSWRGPRIMALGTFLIVLAFAVYHFVVVSAYMPHGAGDAMIDWNLRARFLHRGGENWTAVFHENMMRWCHSDYPLLLSASIARLWGHLGEESTWVPRMIALGFTFGTVGVVVATLGVLRSTSQGYLAGLLLLGNSFLFEKGLMQYADVPLAYFIVCTLALFAMRDRLSDDPRFVVLAGLTAGFAAWTKNEGMLFLVCITVTRTVIISTTGGRRALVRELGCFAVGLFPILVCLTIFKTAYAGTNDLIEGQGPFDYFSRLCDPSRYTLIFQSIQDQLMLIPAVIAIGLGIHVVLVRFQRSWLTFPMGITPLLCLVLLSTGYFFVYVLTPHNLPWHLLTSIDRLLLHVYPAAVFTLFLLLRTVEESLGQDTGVRDREEQPGSAPANTSSVDSASNCQAAAA